MNRRDLLRSIPMAAAPVFANTSAAAAPAAGEPTFKISLAEWSLHKGDRQPHDFES